MGTNTTLDQILSWLVIFIPVVLGLVTRTSAKEREAAIQQTSANVSAAVSESVTRSVSQQYQQTISNLNSKIAQLETDLQSRGKKVDVIGSSNIVTGKKPVKVEVTNVASNPPTVPKN